MRAAVIVEAVNFIVSLTDSIVASNFLGADAFAAIGLISPFLSVSTFLTSIVNTGTVLNYSLEVGRFNKKRAGEFFSQGIILALLIGVLYSLVLFILGQKMISRVSVDEGIVRYLSEYYYIILFFFLLQPLSCVLDNLLVADGGETLSMAANIVLIVSNVTGSVLFAELWGIKGIAIASVLSKVLFILLICRHFLSKKNTLRFVWHWKITDLFLIIRNGIVKASTYGLEALLIFFINMAALILFDEETLVILVVVERFLGMMTLFIGISMASQPLISTLRGEHNTKALRLLMQIVLKDMIAISGILAILTFIFSPFISFVFGIREGEMYYQTIKALRIVSSTLILQALLVLFFIYYVVIGKQLLAFFICLIKNFISPIVLAVLLAVAWKSHTGIWAGLAAAPVISLLLSALIVFLRYGRKIFPFLITEDTDQQIYIYDFSINESNAVKMAETIQDLMTQLPFSGRIRVLAGMILEEVLMLIHDINRDGEELIRAECTVITTPDGMRLILRDSGRIFNLTDEENDIDSFRQYIVSNLMIHQEMKFYMTTTGYNRNELFFSCGEPCS